MTDQTKSLYMDPETSKRVKQITAAGARYVFPVFPTSYREPASTIPP